MSYIDLIVERQIAAAIERGEMDGGALKGKPLPNDDEMRQPGWWAAQLVKRERSRVRREDAIAEIAQWRLRFWRAESVADLRTVVAEANRWVVATNRDLVDTDTLELFDLAELTDTWHATRRR